MDLLISDPYQYLDTFLLVFVRALGLLLIVPVLGNRNVPYIAKISFAFFLSLIVISTQTFELNVSSGDAVNFGIAVIIEFITGWLMGFSAYVVFSIMSLAGQFIDAQIGFSMVNVFDPMSQIQLTITGNLYYYMLIIIVVVTNAHHYFIRSLMDSYHMIPLGGMIITPSLYNSLVEYMTTYFGLALKIASPIFFVMIITNVVLGILARTVPQLNMFVIGFPIKIMFGLLTIYITLSVFANVSDLIISESEQLMREVVKGMMP